MSNLGPNTETNSQELGERLESFIDAFTEKLSSLDKTNTIDFYLFPNEQVLKAREEAAKVMDEYKFSKDDFMQIAAIKPEFCDGCIWLLDHIQGVDIEIINKALELDELGALLSVVEKIPDATGGAITNGELYKLILDNRANKRQPNNSYNQSTYLDTWTDPLLLNSFTKFEGKTFDSVKHDLEKGGTLVYSPFAIAEAKSAQNAGEKVDLHNLRELFVHEYPQYAIHFLKDIKYIQQEEINFVAENAPNLFENIEQLEGIVPTQILEKRFEILNTAKRQEVLRKMAGLGRYDALEILFANLNTSDFANERSLAINILTNGKKEPIKVKEIKVDEYIERDVGVIKGYLQNMLEENYSEAHRQVECLAKLGVNIPTELKLHEQPEKEAVMQIEKYDKVRVANEAAKFYLYEWADYQLLLLKGRMLPVPPDEEATTKLFSEPKEFVNVSDKIEFQQLEATIDAGRKVNIESTFDWMRKFILVAINSELSNQRILDPSRRDYLNPLEIFDKDITPEEIRTFLAKANYIFYEMGQSIDYFADVGGYTWMMVANIAQRAWPSSEIKDRQKAALVDQIFDVEHNTGNIFDKDQNIIIPSKLEPLLKLKFNSTDPNEIKDYAKRNNLLTDEELIQFEYIFSTLEKLKVAPLKSASYE